MDAVVDASKKKKLKAASISLKKNISTNEKDYRISTPRHDNGRV